MNQGPWQEVGDRIYRRWYDSLSLNIGLIVADGGGLVIDTRATYGQADELKEEIRLVTDAPLRFVVNTHHHWDHTFGNARFSDSELIGHRRCAEQLLDVGDSMKEQLRAMVSPANREKVDAIAITPPTTTFSEILRLDLSGREVELSHFGRAHTDNDIIVRVDDVVFAGDIVEESAPPWFGDAYPLEWPATLARCRRGSVFVPGHGDVMTLGAVEEQLEEIDSVARKVQACLESGDPITEDPYPLEVMQTALSRARLTA